MTQVLSPFWYRLSALKPRLAAHASVSRHRYRGQAWYVVEDASAGRYHRFTPQVFLVVGLMDGVRSVDEIWRLVVDQLGDDAPTQVDVVQLLSQLHAADLLQSDISPDAAELFQRFQGLTRSSWKKRILSPLSVKVPLIDPDLFLERTLPFVRPLLGWIGFVFWLAVVLPGMALAAMNWPVLSAGALDHAFAAQNLVAIALIYPVLKTLHELGHGYACKAGGGEVHDMGFMFLVFIPVPYVDASSSSAFRSKYRRAGVGAAGVLVETFIAALAMYVWASVEPGFARAMAFNVMLIAGVSTVVFNINPLMRFDGYYVFADLIEIPNLSQRANRYWGWMVDRHAFGADVEAPLASAGERFWFLFYAPLAAAYRIVLLFGIALFVASKFFVFGVLLALWSVAMGIVVPVLAFLRTVLVSPKLKRKRARAVGLTFAALGGGALLVGLVPMPLHTMAEGVVWLPESSIVRAGDNGFVRRVVATPDAPVRRGDLLIEVEDEERQATAKALRAEIDALEARLAGEDFTDQMRANLTRQEIAVYRASLVEQEARLRWLDVTSPADGDLHLPRAGDLPARYVRRGDILGYVVAPDERQVRVIIPQADAELVLDRLRGVEVRLPDAPGVSLGAEVTRIVPAASKDLPSRALAVDGGGQVAIDPTDRERSRTIERLFQMDLAIPVDAATGHFGSRVHVRFDIGSEPLIRQWYRRVRQVFLTVLDT